MQKLLSTYSEWMESEEAEKASKADYSERHRNLEGAFAPIAERAEELACLVEAVLDGRSLTWPSSRGRAMARL